MIKIIIFAVLLLSVSATPTVNCTAAALAAYAGTCSQFPTNALCDTGTDCMWCSSGAVVQECLGSSSNPTTCTCSASSTIKGVCMSKKPGVVACTVTTTASSPIFFNQPCTPAQIISYSPGNCPTTSAAAGVIVSSFTIVLFSLFMIVIF